MSSEDGETIVKTSTDCWVVGKKSDQREFYVVLNQKNANLIEINGKTFLTNIKAMQNIINFVFSHSWNSSIIRLEIFF